MILFLHIRMHLEELKCSDKHLLKSESLLQKKHKATFSAWLGNKVRKSNSNNMSNLKKWLAFGPGEEVTSYSGYVINGNRIHTKYAEKSTQNSGVHVQAETICRSSARDNSHVSGKLCYYGVIRDIILLDYYKFKYPIFHCDWANINAGVKVEEGFTLVNLHQGQQQFLNDPFILASQVKQVFYSRENDTSSWYCVLKAPSRGFYESKNFDESYYMTSALLDRLKYRS